MVPQISNGLIEHRSYIMTKQTSSNGNPPVKHTKPVSNAEKFRIQQACMALDHPWMKELRPGSLAFKVATQTLLAFPAIVVPADCKVSRTRLAFNKVFRTLSGKDIAQRKSIDHGHNVARKALAWSYDQLKNPAPAATLTLVADNPPKPTGPNPQFLRSLAQRELVSA